MIIHQRKIGYSRNYAEFFEVLVKIKAHMEKKFPEISVELMYNLAGQRGRATIQTRYPSLADYERIDRDLVGRVRKSSHRPILSRHLKTENRLLFLGFSTTASTTIFRAEYDISDF